MEAARTSRYIAVLSEAAGRPWDRTVFEACDECRQRTIDLLESLGYIDARDGDAERGEDPARSYVTGITSLGQLELDALVRMQPMLPPEPPRTALRRCIVSILGRLGV